MKAKSLFAVSLSVVIFLFLALPKALQSGAIYSCNDGSDTVAFSDKDLGENYKCVPMFSFKDITEDERRAWEIENRENTRARDASEVQQENTREINERTQAQQVLAQQQRLRREEQRRIREEQRREVELSIQPEYLRQQQIQTDLEIERAAREKFRERINPGGIRNRWQQHPVPAS
jgi:hypothetical protein